MRKTPNPIDTDILDKLITGRVEPHIYAFQTETVPNYLKVGDTYRPVSVRLDEWRSIYRNLKHVYTGSAKIDDKVIFRDFSVHDYLEGVKHRHRLLPTDIPSLPYYSREFFGEATAKDVDEAISDIRQSARNHEGRYPLYGLDRLPQTYNYVRGESLKPRDNQQEVIDHFVSAVNSGRKNLLMYAVMRFGKSFTSMCCATEMKARRVLVVSAKADVKDEWKKTVESIGNFEGYIFAEKNELLSDGQYLRNAWHDGKNIVLFLTLQDLQGKELKESHKEVFALDWDLLLVDETHFGARAEHYGTVLLSKKEATRQMKDVDTLDELENVVKELRTRITLHLSGTPYRILMGGEFQAEDIISFVQFSDIAEAQKRWDEEHKNDESVEEWDNPYFGFPQMIRFAFRPNETSLERIKQLKATGATTSFAELFRPKSLVVSGELHKQFIHPDTVLNLLQAIDGSKNDVNVLGFLDNDRIKAGKLCRHIVFVLPYCASCDALEEMLTVSARSFKHLGGYEIVNISGLRNDRRFRTTAAVKSYIAHCEKEGKKTITLTVNRMLTGNTVPQWDTMLYLKPSASPEEYDQAVYRLQNPFVENYTDKEGRRIKFNMKPQTILVDFDPERMFRLQERKSQIYNVNTDNNGNSRLRERIDAELAISPIIVLDHNRLREATSANIMDAVRNYEQTRSVLEEAESLPIDFALLDTPELRELIDRLNPIDSKHGIAIPATDNSGNDKGDDVDVHATGESAPPKEKTPSAEKEDDNDLLAKKFASYYALILFFAFLTDDEVESLEDIIRVLSLSADNRRLSKHLGLTQDILSVIQKRSNGFALSKLDYKIQNANSLIRDCDKEPMERVKIALTKFGRMSESEIVTPPNVADEMVGMLPENAADGKILDIASKQGEFAAALLRRFGNEISDRIYSVCTSPMAYEFTRKVYQLLSMPVTHIFDSFTTYDIIKPDNEQIISTLKNMNLVTILGNPPYQDIGGSGGTNDAPIYQKFYTAATEAKSNFISYIIPSRWFTTGRENLLGDFRANMLKSRNLLRLKVYDNSRTLFPNVEIKGGICLFVKDKKYMGDCNYTLVNGEAEQNELLPLDSFDILIREPRLSKIVFKVSNQNSRGVDELISADTPFGIPTRPTDNAKGKFDIHLTPTPPYDLALFVIENLKRKVVYMNRNAIRKNVQDINRHKVFIPEVGGSGNDSKILGNPEYAAPGSVCTQSYLYAAFDSEKEARNFIKYLRTKFLRVLVSAIKITQHATNRVYRFVPLQNFTGKSDIDWSKTVEEIDRQLYKKYGLTDEETTFIERMIKPM